MHQGALKKSQPMVIIFPYTEIKKACQSANWDQIIQIVKTHSLLINYPVVHGQMIAPYPYFDQYQQQFTLLDHLAFRGAPPEILLLLQNEYNALSYNNIYAFQCARASRWDLIAQLPSLNIHAKDIMLGSVGMTLSDHAFIQNQIPMAEYYYSEKNSHYIKIKQAPSPILCPKPSRPDGNIKDIAFIQNLEEQARLNSPPIVNNIQKNNIKAMFQAAETDDWQAVMHYINNLGCSIFAKSEDGKDLMYWAEFHKMNTVAAFLLREKALMDSVEYTPLSTTIPKTNVGFVGREKKSLEAQGIDPTQENLELEFKRLSLNKKY
tara:strand:+ start:242004 stop:242966 length:963 start_codon:yes stop_codon:yes gene_type:complete